MDIISSYEMCHKAMGTLRVKTMGGLGRLWCLTYDGKATNEYYLFLSIVVSGYFKSLIV